MLAEVRYSRTELGRLVLTRQSSVTMHTVEWRGWFPESNCKGKQVSYYMLYVSFVYCHVVQRKPVVHGGGRSGAF